ncbi:FAD-binding oxidoreductase [Nocardiopsis nanhaiensis]
MATRSHTPAARRFAAVSGDVLWRGDPGYREAVGLWNSRAEVSPRAVVRPAGTADVGVAVRAAREAGLAIAVRGGGHHVSGSALCEDGMVLDMRRLGSVGMDRHSHTVTVGAGAVWYDVNAATVRYGRAVPSGNAPSTGVAGVALGGGVGLFSRAWGLTCDRLVGLGLVDAEGEYRRVDRDSGADLFWVARGAGRGIGVVTDLEFSTSPVTPEVATAQVFHPLESAREVLDGWCTAVADGPREVSPQLTIRRLPDAPALAARIRGRWAVSVGAVHCGDPADAGPVLEPYTRLGEPLLDLSGTYPFVEPVPPRRDGLRAYSCSFFLADLDPAIVRALLKAFDDTCPDGAYATLRTLGGAVADGEDRATAFAHRRARFLLTVQAEWSGPEGDGPCVAWCEDLGRAVRDTGVLGIYGNFHAGTGDFRDLREQAYGDTARIDRVLADHDPDGVFHEMAMRP